MRFPSALPDDHGEILWSEGAGRRLAVADLVRARDQGLFDGDPGAIFLEPPLYGGEALPGWLELLHWLEELGVGFLVVTFAGVVRRRYEHWRNRGAITPFGFLDLVVARRIWSRRALSQLLDISLKEATDLLVSTGYVEDDDDDDRWELSSDPTATDLRRKIVEDYLHRRYDEPT